MDKIKIAFIKFAGLSAGGTELFLQTIAANLPKDRFKVDFFYCDSAPYIGSDFKHPDTSLDRVVYLQARGVNLIKFRVKAKDITTPLHKWVETDFWQYFDERIYDIIQTGRAGHKEFPFYKIRKTPIVDSIHLFAGVDNQFNIARVMHLSNWSARKWIKAGGDASRVVIVSHPIEIEGKDYGNLREELGLKDKFVFGFHQRADDHIFSEIPFQAYKQVESQNTAFVLLGGGEFYRRQAQSLGLKNVFFLPFTGDKNKIYQFLNTLDIYAHGRRDGEINSTAMAEAMFFGLPIVSHTSKINNGHIECVGQAGRVVGSVEEYAAEMVELMCNKEYRAFRIKEAKKRFAEKYELKAQMYHIMKIYEDVIVNPFPHRLRRRLWTLHYSQNIKIWLQTIYLFLKFHLKIDLKRLLN